jgi:hypothetical protein
MYCCCVQGETSASTVFNTWVGLAVLAGLQSCVAAVGIIAAEKVSFVQNIIETHSINKHSCVHEHCHVNQRIAVLGVFRHY